jgi:predicted lipid-binding transport protein (Tim44 family)
MWAGAVPASGSQARFAGISMTFSLTRPGKSKVARGIVLGLTLVLASPLSVTTADARAGGGVGGGSRGGRTFSAPPSTATAPSAQPFQRTESARPSMGNPGMGAATAAAPRRFGGFGTGLMAGLLGAGVLGMLTGHGFFGGIGGLLSIFGFLFQIALIGGLIWLAIRFFRGRSAMPAFAGGPAAGPASGGPGPYARSALGGLGGGTAARDSVAITPADYAAFERSLVEIQNAYGREDGAALSRLATPEMVRYFGSDIADNQRRGVRNAVFDAKLLQGDLAEAWREGAIEYATVAMRFSVVDTMVDRHTGRVMSGDSTPTQATELWTFQRTGSGPWLLSAIQQAA